MSSPPKCPNCGEPLNKVEWEEYVTYYFNPETGHYMDEAEAGHNPWGGVGYSKCGHCSTRLNDTPEFEEGPRNYRPPMLEICNECGRSVAQGSGRFVNRIPSADDYRTQVEMGKPYPQGMYMCAECEEKIEEEADRR